jgi:hypothetical protein
MVLLISILKIALLVLAGVSVLALTLVSMFRNNRLLFYCLMGAFLSHVTVAGGLYAAQKIMEMRAQQPEERLVVNFLKKPDPPKKIEPPKPVVLPKTLDLPLGSLTGKRSAKTMPKGTTLKNNASGGTPKGPGRPMVSSVSTLGDVYVDEKDAGLFSGQFQDVIDRRDISDLVAGGNGGGGGGTPDGTGSGDVPKGFPEGKVNGRVYFIRLKHGSGAWNAFNDGTQRLMSFLNNYFPCQSDTWPMTSAELREKYMAKGQYPSFLYLYCDDSFSLNGTDVTVLRDYLNHNGFLFLDSRPDSDIQARVASELRKVIPDAPLAAVSGNHRINSFLFRLTAPGVGENIIPGARNMGVTRGGRLIVFYTMGNFGHLYSTSGTDGGDYILAQYQMGANVMVYAIRRGDDSGLPKERGANAKVTNAALSQLGFLNNPGGGAKPPAGNSGNGEEPSVKVKRLTPEGGEPDPSEPPEPDDVNIIPQ